MKTTMAIDGAAGGTQRRAYWLKTLHQWHWISSAIALVGMLLFAITGITLNHAAQIEAKPTVHTRDGELPKVLLAALAGNKDGNAPLPASVKQWIEREWRLELPDTPAEWSAAEVAVSMPRPGGDAWLRIERATGALEYERTDRGWISYLNDLHKGRHTGAAWSWFIDAFSLACIVFTVTGLVILKMHAANRRSTWPMVGLGLVLPLLLAILFIH
jgi:hypothetical protein